MGCRKYRNALSEAATGTLAPQRRQKLDEHLAQCAGCAARLDRLQRAQAAIHRALSESAAAEPSPEWLHDIERQLRTEAQSTRRRISYGVPAAVAAAIVLAVAAWALLGRRAVQPPRAPASAAVQPPTQTAPPARPEVAPLTAKLAPSRAARPAPRRRTPRPNRRVFEQVKVQPESAAMIRLYDLLQSGKIDPQTLLQPTQSIDKPIVIPPLHIKPLKIPPIDVESDSGFGREQSSGPGRSNGFEAGANKEKTP